jgi:hypothetical protein
MRWHSTQRVELSKGTNDVNVFVCQNCERYAAQLEDEAERPPVE